MQRVALVVLVPFLLGACQQAYLIPDDEAEEDTRGTDEEAPSDSTVVKPNFEAEGWGDPIDVNFTFGGKEQEGGAE